MKKTVGITLAVLVAFALLFVSVVPDRPSFELEPQSVSFLGLSETPPEAVVTDNGAELVITTSPASLPSATAGEHGGHGGHTGGHAGVLPPVQTFMIPVDGYIWGFDYEAIDGSGRILPREVVHHFNIIDPAHRELFLPISQRLIAGGKETGAQSMPTSLFGVPMQKGQVLVISVMLHNPTESDYHGVSLRVRIKYTETDRLWPLFPVQPFQMDVAFPAGEKSFDLPPGVSERSWEGSPSVSGRIMVVASHLHEAATHISLTDATTGHSLWTGYPVYDDDDRLDGVTVGRLYRKLGMRIQPDHTYRVSVHYDNPQADTVRSGGMGVVAGVFLPHDASSWPTADPADDLYAVDQLHYMRQVAGTYVELTSSLEMRDEPVSDEMRGEHRPAEQHDHGDH